MAEKNEAVMKMVERAIKKNPDVSSVDLFEKAKRIDSSLANVGIRSFHASYPLQVKRRLKAAGDGGTAETPRRPGRPRKAPTKEPTTPPEAAAERAPQTDAGKATDVEREQIRQILFKFAGEVAGAEARADVAKVLIGVDTYVEQLITVKT